MRLGIRSLFQTLNSNLNLQEFSSYQDLTDYLSEDVPDIICIVGEMIPCPKHKNFQALKNQHPTIQWIVLDTTMRFSEMADLLLLQSHNQEQTIAKIQDFFKQMDFRSRKIESQQLSQREQDVLKHIALGYSNKEISEQLYLSIHTVISHRRNLTDKLGIKTISGLTVYAIINGLVKAEEVQAHAVTHEVACPMET